jgi:hypothetical protein
MVCIFHKLNFYTFSLYMSEIREGEPFLRKRIFFKNAWHFKDIVREFKAFLSILIVFEDIFREIEVFCN